MQSRSQHQPEMFQTINLDDFVPLSYQLRKIDKVLDLDFVYELTAPYTAHLTEGHPSIRYCFLECS